MPTAPASTGVRRFLDTLYNGAAALAALFMVLLLVMVMLSILGRQLHFNIPGVDAYAGYMMAAAGFLASVGTAIAQGRYVAGTIPLGYVRGADKRLAPDPDTAPVVLGAFERRVKTVVGQAGPLAG